MNKDFVTATPDSGSGGATVSVSASENQGGSRSTSLNVGGSGVNKSVSVSQEEAAITWEYVFSIDRSSGSVGATGGSVQVNITSYKKKIINGKDSGQTESVGVSVGYQSGTDFTSIHRDGLPNYVVVSAGENTNPSSRTEVERFTQSESGYTADFSFSQEAASITTSYTIYFSPGSMAWYGDESDRKTTTITAERRTIVNGKVTSQTPVAYTHTFSGDTGDFNYSQSGNTFSIVPQGTNDSGIDYMMKISAYINEASSYRDTFTALQYTT